MKRKLFREIPADLSVASPEELTEMQDALRASAQEVVENAADPTQHTEKFEGLDPQEVVDEMTAAAEDMARIASELAVRAEGEQAYVESVSAAADAFGVAAAASADGEGEPDNGDGDAAETVEPAAEAEVAAAEPEAAAEVVAEAEPIVEAAADEAAVEAEPVVADARPALRKPRPVPASPSASHQPIVVSESKVPALVAAAGIEGIAEGKLMTRAEFGAAMMEKRRRMVSTPKGIREEVVVASVDFPFPEERWLRENDIAGNVEKLRQVLNPDALHASGGLCAPLTPYYDLAQVAVATRPVRDSLVGFRADRGGVIVGTPATIADIDTAITVVTAEQDAAGGSAATKGCQHIDCPPFTEVEVDVIAKCLEIGNLTGRTYPELVAQWTELVNAAHARTAEGLMLDAIKGYSTEVTQAIEYGALSTILAGILKARSGMISRHRMSLDARFRAIFPFWIVPMLLEDLENSQFERFSKDMDGLVALLRSRGVEPTFTTDTASTGNDQVFPAQTAGALKDWPGTTVEWAIFPEGSFLFVDGGTLDLGLVRDSVLNSTNDYQIFAETFENVAYIGVESLWVASTICPNGTVAAPATAFSCS